MEERTGLFYALLGLALLSSVAFLYGVFPTPYKYLQYSSKGYTFPTRIHRLTGTTEILILHKGWQVQKTPTKPKPLDLSGLTIIR